MSQCAFKLLFKGLPRQGTYHERARLTVLSGVCAHQSLAAVEDQAGCAWL